jgi:L,D-peptidoglycan transpeptidase YkuD (ErfK/YbiS/YcfS/YnhG family)
MKISKPWKRFYFVIAILAFLAGSVYVLIRTTPVPPEEKVEIARIALSRATSSKADTYSRNLFREAKNYYDSAMIHWQKENKRFIYFRNFDKVAEFADLSARKAEQAAKVSRNNLADLNISLKQKIDSLNKLADRINKVFFAYPLSPEIWKRISRGQMLLAESEVAFSKGQLQEANKKVIDSELLLTDSYEHASEHLKEYFTSFPVWKKWVDKTIRESKQNQSYSIIIDKYSRKCLVYYKGEKKYEYKVELGKNWVGDKKVKGDKATPEGMYRIIKKFGNNKTKYHKALLIDYPNDADKVEFKAAVASGTLPRNAKIGSLIEIHGDGGRGVDWTEGCVALTNTEMDVLFTIAAEGTPVTIVGSTVNLNKVID